MSSKMEDLQSRLARIQKEIDEEKARQAAVESLKKVTEQVGDVVLSAFKSEKLDLKHLEGKTFGFQVDSRTGVITLTLDSQTVHGVTQIVKITIAARK